MATGQTYGPAGMGSAGIASLNKNSLNRIIANAQAAQMGNWNWRPTPSDMRQDAINWGQKAGLPNRISFAGESGRDILNPNEMRVNAPSYGDWKSMAKRKMIMDRRYQGEDNPYYGITNPNLKGAKVWNAGSIDPTADDFFLKELYNYGKRYFPGYDAEQDEWRHKRYGDSLEMDETEYIDELPISPLIENPD